MATNSWPFLLPSISVMNKKPSNTKYWLTLTGIAVQMGVIIYLGAAGGGWLDEKYSDGKNTYTVLLTLLAVAISMYLVVRQTKNLNP